MEEASPQYAIQKEGVEVLFRGHATFRVAFFRRGRRTI